MRRQLIALVTVLGLSMGALAVGRVLLPGSLCTVTEAQLDGLVLETMSYEDVKSALGCDGVLVARQDYGDSIRVEDYAWRGDTWPYGRFQGTFINQKMHATSKTWFKFTIAANKP